MSSCLRLFVLRGGIPILEIAGPSSPRRHPVPASIAPLDSLYYSLPVARTSERTTDDDDLR